MKQTAEVHQMKNPVDFEETIQKHLDEQAEKNATPSQDFDVAKNSSKQEDDEEQIDLINTPPLEFMQMYDKLTGEELKHLTESYNEILNVRDEMTLKMKLLSQWCEERNIHFPTFKAAHKRANNPKKMQNMIDATFAWFAKKFGGGYQPGLWK